MILIETDVDSSDLDRWLINKATVIGAGLGEVLREEGSFLLETVTRITPPTDGTLSPSQSWAAGRKAGRNAILGDLAKVYVTSASIAASIRDQDEDAARGFSKAVRKGDVAEAQRIMYAFGQGDKASSNMGNFDPTYHRTRRNNRGRVGRGGVSQVVTNPSGLTKYRMAQLAKVGQLKRGWVVASNGMKKRIRVPAWIARAQGGGSGSMKDNTRNKVDPSISFYNTSRHAVSMDRVVRFGNKALQIRASKVRRSVEHMVRRKWKK